MGKDLVILLVVAHGSSHNCCTKLSNAALVVRLIS